MNRRKNGWSLPWDIMQIISWVIYLYLVITSIIIFIPLPVFPLIPAITLILYLWILINFLYMTTYDPGIGNSDIKPQQFVRGIYEHVIENGYCNICQINVLVFIYFL